MKGNGTSNLVKYSIDSDLDWGNPHITQNGEMITLKHER